MGPDLVVRLNLDVDRGPNPPRVSRPIRNHRFPLSGKPFSEQETALEKWQRDALALWTSRARLFVCLSCVGKLVSVVAIEV